MVSTSDFRNGMVIRLDRQLFFLTEFVHFKPGKGAAVVRTKLKSVKSGAVIDKTFRSGDKVDNVRLEKRKSQYLYKQDAFYIFMDTRTYDQYEVPTETVGNAQKLLRENEIVDVLIAEGNAMGVELPIFVELKVDQTDPGLRGDTATGGTKPARVETGATVQVPLFVEIGDVLKIDTRTQSYVERV